MLLNLSFLFHNSVLSAPSFDLHCYSVSLFDILESMILSMFVSHRLWLTNTTGLMYQNCNDFVLKHRAQLLNRSDHLTGDDARKTIRFHCKSRSILIPSVFSAKGHHTNIWWQLYEAHKTSYDTEKACKRPALTCRFQKLYFPPKVYLLCGRATLQRHVWFGTNYFIAKCGT